MSILQLKSSEELDDMARELGYDPNEDIEVLRNEHPITVNDDGDVMRVMAIVSSIDAEIKKEEEALNKELETVRDFRQSRIERKEDTREYLTLPLQEYINTTGDNYNGPMGHAGFHTVTKTEWQLDPGKLLKFAREHGLRQRFTIKAALTIEEVQSLRMFLDDCDPDNEVSATAYKSVIKDYMRDQGLHGEKGNAVYQLNKRKQFRIKPDA